MTDEHSNDAAEYQFHKTTYDGVCFLLKISIALIIVTLLLLAWLVV